MSVFLDSSSTTRPFDEVILCIADTMKNYYGNASSSHVFGFESEQILRRAKMTVLNFLHSSNGDVFFTSGGTESNNLAIFGSINVRSSNNIVTTMIEHFSVLNPIKKFESLGARVKYLKPDSNGNISIKNFENNISEDTSFISIMHVNNETGEILPIKEFSNIIGR
ncbi:MAG: aminotransferase class V-fold PLP-dependent enzyme, partial [Firmicutes bacterium]|nr:aminotransferase class V-fold PLP-dependent enzyme [Bacillota bacterium]